jgi:iron complex transport system substrate-binding protein
MKLRFLRFCLGSLLVSLALVAFAACGGDDDEASPTAAAPTSPTTSSASPTAAASPQPTSTPETRTVTDMAGRAVMVPWEVERVATSGSVPVLNSFLFAVGAGDRIVSGLPPFAQNPRWDFQNTFAPQLANSPQVDTADRTPDLEAFLSVEPDVTFTFDAAAAETLTRAGLAVVVLKWQEPEDVKKVMSLVGEVLGVEERAAAYVKYFDETLARVSAIASKVPDAEKPRVLYLNPQNYSQPHLIAEWWISQAGGISVTDDGRTAESLTFNVEQILDWDPDVILVPQLGDVQRVYNDALLADVKAVSAQRVYPLPIVAHTWGNRTSEQPLTVMWAAKTINPQAFAELDLHAELDKFFRDIFHHPLSAADIDNILDPTTEPPYGR